MTGFTYLLSDPTDQAFEYIEKMAKSSFTGVFLTMKYFEESKEVLYDRIKTIVDICKPLGLEIMLEIRKEVMNELGLSMDAATIRSFGTDGVKLTGEFDAPFISALSKEMRVGVSAGHVQCLDIKGLYDGGANFDQIEAWYTFYRRPETGLSKSFMESNNQTIRHLGFKIFAFICGDDDEFRVKTTSSPTLEVHRGRHPLYAAIDLVEDMGIDGIYIGDAMITERTMVQFKQYQDQNLLVLYADVLDEEYFEYVKGIYQNRIDEAENVISSEDRTLFTKEKILPRYLISRPRGAVTLDNMRYKNHTGEFQINKVDMPVSDKVNVVAQIREKDIDILDKCRSGTRFQIVDNKNYEL